MRIAFIIIFEVNNQTILTVMNKAFYIIGIVFSVVFIFIGAFYMEEIDSAEWRDYYANDYSYDSYDYMYDSYNYSDSNEADDLTFEIAVISVFFFLLFLTIDLLGLIKVKTKTTKVLSIIGISLSGIFLLWNFALMASGGGISYDEVYPAYVLYSLTILAFTIVGLVQSIKYAKIKAGVIPASTASPTGEEKDLLDS